LLALAYAGFMINLFNLIPMSPLDGGRITAVISPRIWLFGVPVLVVLFSCIRARCICSSPFWPGRVAAGLERYARRRTLLLRCAGAGARQLRICYLGLVASSRQLTPCIRAWR